MGPAAKVIAAAAKPRGHSVNLLVREAGFGLVVGTLAASLWYITVSRPVQNKISDYYKK